MSLLDKLLSIFGGGSTAAGPEPPSESEQEAEPEAEAEEAADEEEAEEEEEAMHSGELAAAADPRRTPGENDTVGDRAANPDDHEGAA